MVKPIIDQPITTRGESTPTTPEVSQSRWGIVRALDRGMETFRAAGPLKRTGMIGLAIVGLAAATLLSPLLGIAVGGAALGYGAARFTKGFVGSKDLASRVESSVDRSLGRTGSEEGVSASLKPQATTMQRVKALEAHQRRLEAQGVLEETGHPVDASSIETLRNNKEIYAQNQTELEFLHTVLEQEAIAESEEWDSKNLSAATPARPPAGPERVYKEEVSGTLSNHQQKRIKEEIDRLNRHQNSLEQSGLLGLNLEKELNFENNPTYQASKNAKAIFEENKNALEILNSKVFNKTQVDTNRLYEKELNDWNSFLSEFRNTDEPPEYKEVATPFAYELKEQQRLLSELNNDLNHKDITPTTRNYILKFRDRTADKAKVLDLINKSPAEIDRELNDLEKKLSLVNKTNNIIQGYGSADSKTPFVVAMLGDDATHLEHLIALARRIKFSKE